MAAFTSKVRPLLYVQRHISKTFNRCQKLLYCTDELVKQENDKKLSGFAEHFIKHSKANDPEQPETFAALLRKSKFIDLGNPVGKVVVGTIYHTKDDNLYIDFGWKFPTVCMKPKKNPELYIKGARVKLLIQDLELSTRFLGSTTDITLCEADCVLLGLAK